MYVCTCMYVFTSLVKNRKERSMALVLAEFEFEFFGGGKKSLGGARGVREGNAHGGRRCW